MGISFLHDSYVHDPRLDHQLWQSENLGNPRRNCPSTRFLVRLFHGPVHPLVVRLGSLNPVFLDHPHLEASHLWPLHPANLQPLCPLRLLFSYLLRRRGGP